MPTPSGNYSNLIGRPLDGLHVWVVEDTPDELRMLAHFLVDEGAQVLDVQLPPPDGFAVCRALRE